MDPIQEVKKPSNAGWVSKVIVSPDIKVAAAPPGDVEGLDAALHQFGEVEVAWYDQNRVKITLKGGAPAVIRQAYLSGANRNVILDIVARGGDE